jgi:hypothetical protein
MRRAIHPDSTLPKFPVGTLIVTGPASVVGGGDVVDDWAMTRAQLIELTADNWRRHGTQRRRTSP